MTARSASGERTVAKMHGARNAFFVLDERDEPCGDPFALARRLCDPHGDLGGADGVLLVGPARGALARMRVINADGSEAEMCGNGVRCVARFLAEAGAPDRFRIETLAGPIEIEVLRRSPVWSIRADVGPVRFPADAIEEEIVVDGRSRTYVSVSLGNPHVVLAVPDVEAVDLARVGRAIATDARFPNGTNVHLMQLLDERTICVRHFERGVGVTLACGTGIVASAATAILRGDVRAPVRVHVPGGALEVDWAPGEPARLTGPAEREFVRRITV